MESRKRVGAYNAQHPPDEKELERVIFYAGQNYIGNEQSEGSS